jgi:serine/threonine-protein kinase
MTDPLGPRARLADRYLLTERIAVGGMGEVWQARDDVLSRTVAVKILKAEYATDPEFLERFRNEAKHTAALSHPGIANVFDYGEVDATAYLVMEYVSGEPLSALLAREGRLSPARALDIIGQVGLALQAAHDAGVVHRDVKPGNVLIRPDGVVKVTDFGIARAVDAVPLTKTGLVVGTAAYLSPEQAAGRPLAPASDIYALGVVGYECLSGRRPFDEGSAVAVAMAHINATPPPMPKDVPPLVVDFVNQALDKQPDRRQRSAADFGRTALALAATLRTADAPPAQPPSTTGTKVLTAVTPAPEPASTATVDGGPEAGRDEGRDDEAQRRRIRNIFIAVGSAVVLIGFLLLAAFAGSPSSPTPRATPTPTPSTTPTVATVTVRAADYLGQSVAHARAALTALGLTVRTTSVPSTATAGTVVGVSPTGTLRRASTVTLTVATAEPKPPAPRHHGKHGKG